MQKIASDDFTNLTEVWLRQHRIIRDAPQKLHAEPLQTTSGELPHELEL